MKRLLFFLLSSAALSYPAHAQELPVGTISENVDFSLLESGNLTNAALTDFEGQIVVLYYYTPW